MGQSPILNKRIQTGEHAVGAQELHDGIEVGDDGIEVGGDDGMEVEDDSIEVGDDLSSKRPTLRIIS